MPETTRVLYALLDAAERSDILRLAF